MERMLWSAFLYSVMKYLVLLLLLLLSVVGAFDVQLMWELPEDTPQEDLTQASARLQLNSSSTSPAGTEWTGIGWDHGSLSVQKLADSQQVVLLQLRSPVNDSSVRAGRVTEFSTAHYISRPSQGMYLQSKIDKKVDDGVGLKVIAHYNMVANNTIYQALWSDGQVWTYMGSLVLQYPKSGSIKEEVAKALEDAAKRQDAPVNRQEVDPLAGHKPPETLATCEITRNEDGVVKPHCRFLRQLPLVPSFSHLYSGIRRTSEGNAAYERSGLFKDLTVKSRLAKVFEVDNARCVSHNRQPEDVASCQRDPNLAEFYIAIDGKSSSMDKAGGGDFLKMDAKEDEDLAKEERELKKDASKLPEIDEK